MKSAPAHRCRQYKVGVVPVVALLSAGANRVGLEKAGALAAP